MARQQQIFALFSVFVALLGCVLAGPDDIYLENGGYKGLLIAIDDNVEYDPAILPNLKVGIIYLDVII